jgi:serine/threonine kinase 16
MANLFLECFGGVFWSWRPGSLHPDIHVGDRAFRVLHKLGEGGYATVFLVKELPSPTRPLVDHHSKYAIKKTMANGDDMLRLIESEVTTLRELQHPNLLHLVDSCITSSRTSTGGMLYEAYLLFPAYEDGTLAAELDRLAAAGVRLPTHTVLSILLQLCLGVQHMHSKGYVHRDIKPHNMLIARPAESPSSSCVDTDVEMAAHAAYEVVLMDFGSSKRMPIEITSRIAALELQEDAEAHCTATYRAPELFDVPSSCTLDGRMDVWAVGCTLYHIMYGASPFQVAIDKGGTLALAVLQCAVDFPSDPKKCYPGELHALVSACLAMDLEARPQIGDVITTITGLQALGLPNPGAAPRAVVAKAAPADAGNAVANDANDGHDADKSFTAFTDNAFTAFTVDAGKAVPIDGDR